MGISVEFGARQSCSTLQLVHAAGTFEDGLGSIGALLSRGLADVIPGTTSYGVPYDTSVFNGTAEYNKTIEGGATMTAQHLQDQLAQCPDQRFVLSGASKGAAVIHSMLNYNSIPSPIENLSGTNLDDQIKSKVSAILVFGDPWRSIGGANNSWPIDSPSVNASPRNGTSSSDNIISFCNSGDTICEAGSADPNALPLPHFTYGKDGSIEISINFIKSKFQSN